MALTWAKVIIGATIASIISIFSYQLGLSAGRVEATEQLEPIHEKVVETKDDTIRTTSAELKETKEDREALSEFLVNVGGSDTPYDVEDFKCSSWIWQDAKTPTNVSIKWAFTTPSGNVVEGVRYRLMCLTKSQRVSMGIDAMDTSPKWV